MRARTGSPGKRVTALAKKDNARAKELRKTAAPALPAATNLTDRSLGATSIWAHFAAPTPNRINPRTGIAYNAKLFRLCHRAQIRL